MCRSIKVLRGMDDVSADDVEAAALQFVRKIAGMRKPSRKNEDAFNAAVEEITLVSAKLLERIDELAGGDSPPLKLRMTPIARR